MRPADGGTALAATSDIIYVSHFGNDTTGNGSEAEPYRTITKALSVASAGQTVWVFAGTYSATNGETFPLQVPAGVKLIGDPIPSWVFWSSPRPTLDGEDTHAIIEIVGGNSETVVEGFDILNGRATRGGGIHIVGGTAPGYGPVIQRNYFHGCEGILGGGAIYIEKGGYAKVSALVRHNRFVACSSASNPGGAIAASSATLNISDCYFWSCDALYGGGVYAGNCRGYMTDCTFEDCSSPLSGGLGGAICTMFSPAGAIDIERTVFEQCSSEYGGGIYSQSQAALNIRNVDFVGCQSVEPGGAVWFQDGDLLMDGCTVRDTTTGSTGEAVQWDAVLGDSAAIRSSIFWNNGGNDVSENLPVDFSMLQEGQPGSGNIIGQDPRFVAGSDYPRLKSYSPAIDAGDPASSLTEDLEGVPRPDGRGGSGRVDMGACEYGVDLKRVYGSDRYKTAKEIAGDRFMGSQVAVLATGRDFPDALCAAPLAGFFDAPILLTDRDSLPAVVRDKLESADVRLCYLIGGSNAISAAVEDEIRSMGIRVHRLAGSNRYETARKVAEETRKVSNFPLLTCAIARGENFPDALALSPLAYDRRIPILLVAPDELPDSTREHLETYSYTGAIVAGGEGAVSADVFNEVDALTSSGAIRKGGSDRFETARVIADYALNSYSSTAEFVGIAVGDNFPDALAGGAAAGLQGGVLLLTRTDGLPPATSDFLNDNKSDLRHIEVFGGPRAVSDSVISQIDAIAP